MPKVFFDCKIEEGDLAFKEKTEKFLETLLLTYAEHFGDHIAYKVSLLPDQKRTFPSQKGGAIYVDLDGTLALYTSFISEKHIGLPVEAMLDRVKKWIAEGKNVKIFTARAYSEMAKSYIEDWLIENGIGGLEITNIKGPDGYEFWDDRAIAIEKNTGKILNIGLEEK